MGRIGGTCSARHPFTKKEYVPVKKIEKFFNAVAGMENWLGMRIGELLTLTYNDIDLEKRIISVSKSCQRIEGRNIITPPKTPKSKRINTRQ